MKKICLFIFAFFVGILFLGSVRAEQKEVSCYYYNGNRRDSQYTIVFRKSATTIEMKSCEISSPQSTTSYSCNDYKFDSKNHYIEKDGKCPSSIDVDSSKKIITWVTKSNGEYKIQKDYVIESTTDDVSPCFDYNDPDTCVSNPKIACIWVGDEEKKTGYCNVDNLQYVFCGDAYDIPRQAPKIISFGINFMKIVTPIILIFVGTITLIKAITASKEDEIKKATSSLIKKLISAALVFFVTSIVQFVILKVAEDSDKNGITSCLSCFLNNECNSAYYKETFKGVDSCRLVSDNSDITCPRDVINK
ncbi:MAG: hypothetical protein Q4E75_05570 [bacterium]|nr:hypothetical protein [bacterium]